MASLPALPLPEGITSDYIKTPELTYHILEAGRPLKDEKKPLLLLLHGFPELAFSWRHVMLPIAKAGYHAVAFDQRGYGRTTGWDNRPYDEVDLNTFRISVVVADALRLVAALGYEEVQCVIGHDFGAAVASACALTRPDVFKSVITMSHVFGGAPSFPFNIRDNPPPSPTAPGMAEVFANLALLQEPRKHYQAYFAGPTANKDIMSAPQGLQTFLSQYFLVKSGTNFPCFSVNNAPRVLNGLSAAEMAYMPYYYIMPLHSTMPEALNQMVVKKDDLEKLHSWMKAEELEIYVQEFERNGFQGGLNYYRVGMDPRYQNEMPVFAGRKIEVPYVFIAGDKDWGAHQSPGALGKMGEHATKYSGAIFVPGAGHWVMQEEPGQTVEAVLDFLKRRRES